VDDERYAQLGFLVHGVEPVAVGIVGFERHRDRPQGEWGSIKRDCHYSPSVNGVRAVYS
jgi:hypothetical protein